LSLSDLLPGAASRDYGRFTYPDRNSTG